MTFLFLTLYDITMLRIDGHGLLMRLIDFKAASCPQGGREWRAELLDLATRGWEEQRCMEVL